MGELRGRKGIDTPTEKCAVKMDGLFGFFCGSHDVPQVPLV